MADQEQHDPVLTLKLSLKFDNLPVNQNPKEIEKLLKAHCQGPITIVHSKICDFCNKKLPFSFVSKECEDCNKTYDICEECCLKAENINLCFRH